MRRVFSFFLFALVAMTAPVVAHAAITPASREVLEIASELGTEGEGPRIRKELEALPRAKVVAAVREGLNEGAPFSLVAARTANVLHLTEVSGDLEKAFAKNDDWTLALALASVADEAQKSRLAMQWQGKLASFESPTRIAILQMLAEWQHPLQTKQFDQSLNDESSQVRLATVRNFVLTREKLSTAEQIARYKKAFAMKPYQVRLSAMVDYNALSKAERAKLSKAIDEKFKSACKVEDKPLVKTECEKVLKGAK
jgi:hypothetical protein